jgi:hypothetical protein
VGLKIMIVLFLKSVMNFSEKFYTDIFIFECPNVEPDPTCDSALLKALTVLHH